MAGVKKARSSSNVKTGRSGATLVVVPPGLVQQWDDERKVSAATISGRIPLEFYLNFFLILLFFLTPFCQPMYRNSPATNSNASLSTVSPH